MMNDTLIIFAIILIVIIACFLFRISGRELVRRSRSMISTRSPAGLNAGKKREKAIFGGIGSGTIPTPGTPGVYERPLDVAANGAGGQVLPPPEPVQGINAGNEVI